MLSMYFSGISSTDNRHLRVRPTERNDIRLRHSSLLEKQANNKTSNKLEKFQLN